MNSRKSGQKQLLTMSRPLLLKNFYKLRQCKWAFIKLFSSPLTVGKNKLECLSQTSFFWPNVAILYHKTSLKKTCKGKHSSLLCATVSDEEKKFYQNDLRLIGSILGWSQPCQWGLMKCPGMISWKTTMIGQDSLGTKKSSFLKVSRCQSHKPFFLWHLAYRGRIFSCVRPICEWAVSDLDP